MGVISLSVTDDLKAKVQARAARGGYTSVDEYICVLIRDDIARDMDPEVEAELLKALDGPGDEMAPAVWETMRTELLHRHARTTNSIADDGTMRT